MAKDKIFGLNTNELLIIGVAGYFITKGLLKLPTLGKEIEEAAITTVENIPQGTANVIVNELWQLTPTQAEQTGNHSFIAPNGNWYSTLQTPPSSTSGTNEWGEGTSYMVNTPSALPPNTYTGINEWGEGTAIITSTQLTMPTIPTYTNAWMTGQDWIAGVHLW